MKPKLRMFLLIIVTGLVCGVIALGHPWYIGLPASLIVGAVFADYAFDLGRPKGER